MKLPRRYFPKTVLTGLLGVLLVACGGGSLPHPPTPTTEPAPPAGTSASPETTAGSPAVPAATPDPTARPLPAEPVVLDPPELALGGVSVVYLYEPAEGATLTFGGRQYPMLRDGERWWAIIGVGAFAETGIAPLSIAYTGENGDDEVLHESIEIVSRDFPVEHIELDEQTASLLQPEVVQDELDIRAGVLSGYTARRLWSGSFVPPADGVISGIFGEGRSYNQGPVSDYHRGTDFIGDTGDPVYAAAAGEVVFVQELQVRGNTIIIDHGAGVFTAYAHLSEFDVAEGEAVTPGQRIGAIGSTGLVTGPHLHWEVIVRGIEVDGELWLEDPIGP